MKNKHFLSLVTCALAVILTVAFCSCGKKEVETAGTPSSVASSAPTVSMADTTTDVSSVPEEETATQVTSEDSSVVSEEQADKSESSQETQKPALQPSTETTVSGTPFSAPKYNTNLDIEDNVFMDSLLYTGYNMKKHRADGNMWIYILSADKRGLGYLSKIGYGGGSSGLETTSDGLPDIKAFEQYGLVCASFASYVYFNYLPNVAGIDTSMLTKPDRTYNAHSFLEATRDWVEKGYARTIGFTASRAGGYIQFTPDEEIPIGSIMIFEDDRLRDGRGSHVVVYGGYKNGNHWVYQVGTDNGPEMCAVERMLFGPDPQWPLLVVTPTTLRLSASVEITVKDQDGNPVSNVAFSAKNAKNGKMVDLGKTDKNGVLTKDGLNYGDYEITQSVPAGYTCSAATQKVKLTPENNSQNCFTFNNTRE